MKKWIWSFAILLSACASDNRVASELGTVSVARVGGVRQSDYFCKTSAPLQLDGLRADAGFVFCAESPELTTGAKKDDYQLLPWDYFVISKPTPRKIFASDSLFLDGYKVNKNQQLRIRRYESLGAESYPVYDFDLQCSATKCERRNVMCLAAQVKLSASDVWVQLKKKSFDDDFLMQELAKRAIFGDAHAREFFLKSSRPRLGTAAGDEYDLARTKLDHLKKVGCLE